MDVKSLLNEEEAAPRPSLQRFGPFKPQLSCDARLPQLQPHHLHPQRSSLPAVTPFSRPAAQQRSLSPSSSSSSSCNSSASPAGFCPAEPLPSISSRVPPLARSESGGSQSPYSPSTPSGSPPTATPLEHEPLRHLPNTKSVPFINLPIPRPQIVSTSSFSAAPSGPPSSMDSFAATPNNLTLADLSFPPSTTQAPPYLLSPQSSLTGISDQTLSSASPPSTSSHTASGPTNSNTGSKSTQKKNSYPCPLARQYACNEYFTTSGHAARHAKKHTGRKDAVCPECSKAFTRKDNMEQHRRTHAKDSSNAASRTATKAGSDKDDSRQRKLTRIQQHKRSRPPSLSGSSIASSTPITNQINPVTTAASASPSLASPTMADMSSRTSYPPTTGSLPMDGTLDPRLRESPSSVNSGSRSVSAFSPSSFTPTVFSMPDNHSSIYSNFSPVFSQGPMAMHQAIQAQPLQLSNLNLANVPAHSSPMSPTDSFGHRQSTSRGSYGGGLEYRLQSSPISPTNTSHDGLDVGLGMTIPGTVGLDMAGNPNIPLMMDHNLHMSPLATSMGMIPTSALAAGVPMGDPTVHPAMGMAPAFDKMSLDKLALAAEAAQNKGN